MPPASPLDPDQWLKLARTVRFGDTDAAGVMHFHQLLRWCHEAWEESLERFGLPAAAVFPGALPATPAAVPEAATRPEAVAPAAVALPIVHCRADFRRPLVCGDRLLVQLAPQRLDPTGFEVAYGFFCRDELAAQGLTRHLAIDPVSRRRCPLPSAIDRWLEASGLASGVRPL